MWDDLSRINIISQQSYPKKDVSPPIKRLEVIERKIMGFIIWRKITKHPREDVDIKKIEERISKISEKNLEDLEKKFEKEKELLLFEIESYYNNKANLTNEIEELLRGLEEEYLKIKFMEAMERLQKAEQSRNSLEILKYLEDCQTISQKINTLKNIHEKK